MGGKANNSTKANSVPRNEQSVPCWLRDLLTEKRRLRKEYQRTRSPRAKTEYNRCTRKLRDILATNQQNELDNYISGLSPFADKNYSLWKAIKSSKKPKIHHPPLRMENGNWARRDGEKAALFATHLTAVFSPHEIDSPEDAPLLNSEIAENHTIFFVKPKEVSSAIRHIKKRKAPGWDGIEGRMVKEMPQRCLLFLTKMNSNEVISELLMEVLRELKYIKALVVENARRIDEIQSIVDAITNTNRSLENSSFPVKTLKELEEVEKKWKNSAEDRRTLSNQLRLAVDPNNADLLEKIMCVSDVLVHFNISGRCGKKNLFDLEIIKFVVNQLNVRSKLLASYYKRFSDRLSSRLRMQEIKRRRMEGGVGKKQKRQ
ncbi:hypothetical protein DMENIID0001_059390 [Sergentomyia squamirostris]